MDKQFKRGDLQTLAFNELAAGPGTRCPRLTFYLAPGVPPRRWLRGPARTVSCPSCHGRGVEGLKIITGAGGGQETCLAFAPTAVGCLISSTGRDPRV